LTNIVAAIKCPGQNMHGTLFSATDQRHRYLRWLSKEIFSFSTSH
jgi:hypothetical protein